MRVDCHVAVLAFIADRISTPGIQWSDLRILATAVVLAVLADGVGQASRVDDSHCRRICVAGLG
jgi:hypothetical protein